MGFHRVVITPRLSPSPAPRARAGVDECPAPQFAERSVALRDGEAVEWLGSRGFWCEPYGPFHLYADRLVDGSFEVARIWHTPARLGRLPEAAPARRETFLQIDGSIVFAGDTTTSTLAAGGTALLPSSAPWSSDSAAATARIEIRVSSHLWEDDVASGGIETLDAMSGAFRDVLVATVISALSSSLHPDDAGFPSYRLAVESLVAALPAMRVPRIVPVRPEELLWRQACEIIGREAADPTLTVTQLADRLLVSGRHLHRAFAERGATPLGAIRSARAALARHHLEVSDGTRSARSRSEIARLSGFRTARAMNEALRYSR